MQFLTSVSHAWEDAINKTHHHIWVPRNKLTLESLEIAVISVVQPRTKTLLLPVVLFVQDLSTCVLVFRKQLKKKKLGTADTESNNYQWWHCSVLIHETYIFPSELRWGLAEQTLCISEFKLHVFIQTSPTANTGISVKNNLTTERKKTERYCSILFSLLKCHWLTYCASCW